ncbi:hypothetical protein AN958_12124 [Leucoagaricus sp. SymC.cos]|nr:hypothetical protein AN958_12124 [Leucoagaricus sp. SymC.cos]
MTDKEKGDGTDFSDNQSQLYERPKGFKGLYRHPITQVTMLGFVCFMCPGLFNALNGLGAGGQVDATTSANANAALYSTFAFFGFFAGSINNVLGSRLTLLIGSTGYALYIGSYLAMNIHPNAGPFVITAGAILGICAGMLWAAQGSLMLAYPTENEKGRFISIFWGIFNLGAVVGASVALGTNFHSEANAGEPKKLVYTSGPILIILLFESWQWNLFFIPLFMANPGNMIRTDGTRVVIPQHPSWKTELIGLVVSLKNDPLIFLLFPMFLASNWFYTWQFNDFNGAIFNIRGRSLNGFLYWISQIIGSLLIGLVLDRKGVRRRVRAFTGWTILFAMVWAAHIWAYFYQRRYTRDHLYKLDIYDKPYIGRAFLYILFGMLDAVWQVTSYWLMGAMSNDAAKLAYMSGFYKSLQSAGAAGMWRADAVKLPYMNIFLSTWVLLLVGLVCALPMIHWRVKDHTEESEDLPYVHQSQLARKALISIFPSVSDSPSPEKH